MPHTVEEAYEVAEAALADDPAKLRDELGDLLFQVFFLSLLLEEQGEGDLDAVARGVHEKLVRRHPHVFGDAEAGPPARPRAVGDDQDRAGGARGRLPRRARVAPGPACARKVQRRAAAVGYDWPDLDGPAGKVREELDELSRGGRAHGSSAPGDRARPARLGRARRPALHGREPRAVRQRRPRARAALHDGAVRRPRRACGTSWPRSAGETWAELDLDAQERWYERAKAALGSADRG